MHAEFLDRLAGSRGVVMASAGFEGKEHAVGFEGPIGTAHRLSGIFGMVQGVKKQDHVERGGAVEALVVTDLIVEIRQVGFIPSAGGRCNRFRRDVDSEDLMVLLGQDVAQPADAAAEMEHPLGRVGQQVEQRREIGQIEFAAIIGERFAERMREAGGTFARVVFTFALFGIRWVQGVRAGRGLD